MLDFSKNYFELFGLPVGFVVDMDALAERYRELQRVLHPDRFANAGEQEKRLSMQGATQVNEAYATLRDPLKRAIYLLSLHGIDIDAEKETTHDAAFLMEQLELREELEQAARAPDPQAVVGELLDRIGASIQSLLACMAILFESPTPENLEAARELVRKMQFLHKLYNEAEAVEARLEDAV